MIRPILFNTEMVKAILKGRKTVTRRIIYKEIVNQFKLDVDGTVISYIDQDSGGAFPPIKKSPIKLGDILWVRETWSEWNDGYAYKAIDWSDNNSPSTSITKWKPSMYMPKEAARIFLEVTDIRVEQLQNIKKADILKEGYDSRTSESPRVYFRKLWNSTTSKKDYKWESNPWVWVVEFKRCKKPAGWLWKR